MRIERVEVFRLPLRLRAPYAIAYETIDRVENLAIRVVTDGPHVGLGIAAPDEGVTGETIEQAEATLRDVAAPLLTRADPLRRLTLLEPMRLGGAATPSARAAVDMALHDLLGKAAGIPMWRILGGYRSCMRTSITLCIDQHDTTVREARARIDEGFRALKLKGGKDVEAEIGLVLAVREIVGSEIEIRFDANQGYTADEAVHFFRATRSAGLSVLEQPTCAGERAVLREVTQAVAMPVMADESIRTLADVFLLARGEVVDMVNLKLAKLGGLDAAMLMNGVARAAGLEVMVGCVDEAALSIAAGLAFALSRPNVEFADLDGHLDLLDDPTASAVILKDGVLHPAQGPGFGVVDIG